MTIDYTALVDELTGHGQKGFMSDGMSAVVPYGVMFRAAANVRQLMEERDQLAKQLAAATDGKAEGTGDAIAGDDLDRVREAWTEYDDWRKESYLYPDGTQQQRAEDLYVAVRDALGHGPRSTRKALER